MLISMLRSIGIEAYPLLISTREHGQVFEAYPITSQLNHVLVYVNIDQKKYFLDATDRFRSYKLLPLSALNHQGWLVENKKQRWVTIPDPKQSLRTTIAKVEFKEDATMKGVIETEYQGYYGVNIRRELENKDEDDFLRNYWFEEFTDFTVDSFQVVNKDSVDLALKIKIFFSAKEFVQAIGNNMYFNPKFFNRLKENPFKLANRTFPVDYGYTFIDKYKLNMKLPEGFKLLGNPENINVLLDQRGGSFQRITYLDGNILTVQYRFSIDRTVFGPSEYKRLRKFYDIVVSGCGDQLILTKNDSTDKGKNK
jgi:hypothetical protein